MIYIIAFGIFCAVYLFHNSQTKNLKFKAMKTINENETLYNFNAWSGAVDTKNTIIENGKAEEFDSLIEELYPEGLTETQLNDLLWFDDEWIFKTLGITEEVEEEEMEGEDEK